ALADEEPEVVHAALRALGRLGRTDPLVTVVATSRDPALVRAALRALIDTDPARALDAARPLVSATDSALACAAVGAGGRMAVEHGGRTEVLFSAPDHADPDVVKLALAELGRVRDAPTTAHVALLLDHASREVRRLAAELLAQESDPIARALVRAR